MRYLARIELSVEQIESLEIRDNYIWHQRLWECFPSNPDQRRDFLTRIDLFEGGSRAWLLARRCPECPEWCPEDCFSVKELSSTFLGHSLYAFDLRANPVKAITRRDERGNRMSSKRVPLIRQEDLCAWIDRKAHDGGFQIDDSKPLEIGPVLETHFRKDDHSAYHGGAVFRGVLEVTDPARFKQTYESGIGSAKAFGFGLLLLAPINN